MEEKKRFISKHAKSSALAVSLAIHALLLAVALSFVAVTVIKKEDKRFEAKPVSRPKMNLRKLQVPVNVKKKKVHKPKLRKRIVVQPKFNRSIPDIKMPEVSGIKGGMDRGAAGAFGAAGGIGFSMPEIEIFGIKGKGEKIFLILDAGNHMLTDEMGGIPAYTIIKNELVRIVEELPPTALFNICIFGGGEMTTFPNLVSANKANIEKVKAWLDPLNASEDWSNSNNYGLKTLGSGGVDQHKDMRIGRFSMPVKKGGGIYNGNWVGDKWYTAVMLAHQQQADTIFLLTNDWGHQRVNLNHALDVEEWIATTSEGRKWNEFVQRARKLLDEENNKRAAAGKPPKVVSNGRWGLIAEYFQDEAPIPPEPDWYFYEPKEFVEAFLLTREKYRSDAIQTSIGLNKKKKRNIDFSFNVVQFIRANGEPSDRSAGSFKKLTSLCGGKYQTVAGLEQIENHVSSN